MTESALSSIAADAAQRIGAIVDAARHEADELLVSARREADEIVTAARLEAAERRRRDADRVQAELQRLRELTHTIGIVAAQIGEQSRTVQQLASDNLLDAPAVPPAPPVPVSEAIAAPLPSLPAQEAVAAPLRSVPRPEERADVAPATPPVDGQTAETTGDRPADERPAARPADSSDRLDAARLVALSMAATGSDRERVEQHLQDELQIRDTSTVIDYVFGISTPASVVPSWPPNRSKNGDRN